MRPLALGGGGRGRRGEKDCGARSGPWACLEEAVLDIGQARPGQARAVRAAGGCRRAAGSSKAVEEAKKPFGNIVSRDESEKGRAGRPMLVLWMY